MVKSMSLIEVLGILNSTLPSMLNFPGKQRDRLVLSQAELLDWDCGSGAGFELEELCESPPILREATTFPFLKRGGGEHLFSYKRQ